MPVNLLSVLQSKPFAKIFSSLSLHYLYRRQAAPRKNLSKQNLNYIHFVSFCFSLGLHYLCIQNINKEKC